MTYKKSEQTVLCLTTTSSKKLTKTFDKERNSTTGTASSFIHNEHQVPNIEILYSLLNQIQDEPLTVIVSGVLTGDARKLKTISRKKEHIIDKKRAWCCLDIDSFELPSDKDVVNEPATCVEHFINTSLPADFSNTQYVYQLSSSCGVKSRHPDERADKLLRLARESESTQAIDRLRSVRSENQKTVWLLCNVPLDITVNHLLNWDMLNTIIEIVSTEDCFAVHRDFHYFKDMEQSARSRNIRKWQSMHFANRASISQMHKTQFSVMTDSNSPFIAFISTKYNGSKEELIASKLGLSEEDIAVERMDMKSN